MANRSSNGQLPTELDLWPALRVGAFTAFLTIATALAILHILSLWAWSILVRKTLSSSAYPLSGTSGFVVGGFSGLIRSSPPALFAIASGVQWFALGSTFWGNLTTPLPSQFIILVGTFFVYKELAARGAVLHAWGPGDVTSKQKTLATGIAGAFSGGFVGLLMRGRSNALPGAAMFSIFGLAGQTLYNFADAQHSRSQEMTLDGSWKESVLERLANSRWSPVKVLSDEEYEQMLRDKLLRVNAEIALIDEDIEKLKKDAEEWKKTSVNR